jgi:hypothetical protein
VTLARPIIRRWLGFGLAFGARSFARRGLALGAFAALVGFVPRSDGALVTRERVEISAPILPDETKLVEPPPATLAEEQAVVDAAALTYEPLLAECAAYYPAITPPPADGTPLTPEQLAANYDAVGDCAYTRHTSKPYWIPKLVDDVDVCGRELGSGWRLISEDDLSSLTEADYQFMKDTLTPVAGPAASSSWSFGSFYFGLHVWLRAHDGTLATGDLSPGVTGPRVAPIDYRLQGSYTTHYEGGLALRCIRRTDLP